jgi:mRNA interferase RelE/StbE
MRRTEIAKPAQKYLASLAAKHLRQIASKIDELVVDPEPNDSKPLHGHPYRRADIGEHRIIYHHSDDLLYIPLIGKRNDGDVYRRLDRLGG